MRRRLDDRAAVPALVRGEQSSILGEAAALVGAERELLTARGAVEFFGA
jgi:hypothetical protein